MTAYVICANNVVEFVILDDEKKAKRKSKELEDKHWEEVQYSFLNRTEYHGAICWYIYSVEYE